MEAFRSILVGKIAGAAGTVALDAATYADMLLRGRSSSTAPADLVKKLAGELNIAALSGEDESAGNRRSGAGALLGYVNGVGLGGLYGLLRCALGDVPPFVAGLALGAAAMAASDIPLVRAGVTDPRSWGTVGWLADIVPHAAYGLTTAYAFELLAGED